MEIIDKKNRDSGSRYNSVVSFQCYDTPSNSAPSSCIQKDAALYSMGSERTGTVNL